MTKLTRLVFLSLLCTGSQLLAQESPTPSPTETLSPSPTASASASRSVPLRFVPPPMEGTISLGIWNSNDKLVRVLHREAKIDKFTVEENSLSTTWDGKDDLGQDLPPGKYRARGYLVAQFKIDNLGKVSNLPNEASEHVPVKLVVNPLVSDTRSIMDIAVSLDVDGDFLKTMDGLPLRTISTKPGDAPNAFNSIVKRTLLTKSGERAVDVWEDWTDSVYHLRVSNIDKMMAFDCGFFELK
jgi:hypothetical protein